MQLTTKWLSVSNRKSAISKIDTAKKPIIRNKLIAEPRISASWSRAAKVLRIRRNQPKHAVVRVQGKIRPLIFRLLKMITAI